MVRPLEAACVAGSRRQHIRGSACYGVRSKEDEVCGGMWLGSLCGCATHEEGLRLTESIGSSIPSGSFLHLKVHP